MEALKGKTKFIVWGLVVIAVVAFFLPFFKVSMDFMGIKESSSISVLGMSTSFEVFGTPASGNGFWFVMLILPLLAVAVSFIKNSKTRAILYIVIAALVLLLTIVEFVVTKSKLAILGDMVKTGIGFGFILYLLFGLCLTCVSVIDLKNKE